MSFFETGLTVIYVLIWLIILYAGVGIFVVSWESISDFWDYLTDKFYVIRNKLFYK